MSKAMDKKFRVGARAIERATRAGSSAGDGDGKSKRRRDENSDGARRGVGAMARDEDVDAYLGLMRAWWTLSGAVDAMTHAQRWEDARAVVEWVEVELAMRRESAFWALRQSERDLEDALVDAKMTPDTFVGFTSRGAVEREGGKRRTWDERVRAAGARCDRDGNSVDVESIVIDGLMSTNDDPVAEHGGEHVVIPSVERFAPSCTDDDAARRIQAAYRGHASRMKTNAEARRELEHLRMIPSARFSNKKAEEMAEMKRREQERERSERGLASLQESVRRDLIANRGEQIREELIASVEREATVIESDEVQNDRVSTFKHVDADVEESVDTSVDDENFMIRFTRAFEKYTRRWADDENADLNAFDVEHVRATVLNDVSNAMREEIEDHQRILAAENKKKSKPSTKKKASSASTLKAKDKPSTKAKAKKPKTSKTKTVAKEVDTELIDTLVQLGMLESVALDGRLMDYVGTGGERREGRDESTMLEIFQLLHILAVSVTTPLASQRVHEHAPHMKCVLLEGPDSNGKSYLARLCAAESGCALYNLSADRLAYAESRGANVKGLIKSVFQAAKLSSPSVILIRHVDAFFPEKGKKAKASEAAETARKLRKDVAKEIKALKPGARVVVMCTRTLVSGASSSEPKGFDTFFSLRLEVPAPDYGGRRRVLSEALRAASLAPSDHLRRRTGDDAFATLVCHASKGMTTGALYALARAVATHPLSATDDPWRALLRRIESN